MAVTTHFYGKNLLFVEGLRNDDMDIMAIDSPNWKAQMTCHHCGGKGHFK